MRRIRLVYFLYGNAILLPWSSKLSALDFFEDQLPGYSISFYISFLSHFFLPIMMVAVVVYGYKYSFYTKVNLMILT